jgi:uncharacterized membrane protein YjdF
MKFLGIYLAYFMQFLILVSIVYSAYKGDYFFTTIGVLVFFITLIPYLVEREWYITLPWEINFLIVLALYLHFSGHVLGLYDIFYPYYDKIAHFISAFTIATLGFVMVLLLHRYSKIECTRMMVILFIIVFTMAIGAWWEIYEWLFDSIFGTALQHGLDDTMLDLLFDFCGALVFSPIGLFYLTHLTVREISTIFLGEKNL